jgi:putative transcriptional regulator
MKTEDFEKLLESVKQAVAIKNGDLQPSREFVLEKQISPVKSPRTACNIDVKAIRTRLGLTQRQFALFMRVNQRTLQNWEQKRREPDGPAQVLLTIVIKDPNLVLEALHS